MRSSSIPLLCLFSPPSSPLFSVRLPLTPGVRNLLKLRQSCLQPAILTLHCASQRDSGDSIRRSNNKLASRISNRLCNRHSLRCRISRYSPFTISSASLPNSPRLSETRSVVRDVPPSFRRSVADIRQVQELCSSDLRVLPSPATVRSGPKPPRRNVNNKALFRQMSSFRQQWRSVRQYLILLLSFQLVAHVATGRPAMADGGGIAEDWIDNP